jgi:hypothetical protein
MQIFKEGGQNMSKHKHKWQYAGCYDNILYFACECGCVKEVAIKDKVEK